jgi:HTH-type transcriptional regulator / antitoxin HipB
MNYPVSTPAQLQAMLRSMRSSKGMSQEELGKRIGVSQRRIAAIEAAPGRASFDQLTRVFATLGGELVVADSSAEKPAPAPTKRKASRKAGMSEKVDW